MATSFFSVLTFWWLKASVNWQRTRFILGWKTKCKVERCTESSMSRIPDNSILQLKSVKVQVGSTTETSLHNLSIRWLCWWPCSEAAPLLSSNLLHCIAHTNVFSTMIYSYSRRPKFSVSLNGIQKQFKNCFCFIVGTTFQNIILRENPSIQPN